MRQCSESSFHKILRAHNQNLVYILEAGSPSRLVIYIHFSEAMGTMYLTQVCLVNSISINWIFCSSAQYPEADGLG